MDILVINRLQFNKKLNWLINRKFVNLQDEQDLTLKKKMN